MIITQEDFNQVRDKASSLRALVIGDIMLDRYIHGIVERISPEAPVPIVQHQYTEVKAGGAANVAMNLAAWGCQTGLVGLVGQDPQAKTMAALLDEQNIRHHLIESASRPTSIKTRVVASSHHLLRIDEESVDYLQDDEEQEVIRQLDAFMTSFRPDLIILEDYNKGLLTDLIIVAIRQYCAQHPVYLAVDPKDKHFFSYAGSQLFKPNLREASHALRKSLHQADLESVCREWRNRYEFGTVAITLGAHGIYLQNDHQGTQVRPEKAIDVVDVCGAGDAVICSLALGLMAGLSLEKSGALANLTGAYVCSHSGVVAVDVDEIYRWI